MSDRPLLAGEHVVLALLALRPMHGYEMLSYLEGEGLVAVCPVEQSTLYTYLRNVEARGYVDWAEERVGQRPPRKTYRLTQEGRDLIEPWLRQPVERMREVRLEFLIKLYFLGQIDPVAHTQLLAEQIAVCEAYLAGLAHRRLETPFSTLVAQSKRSAAEATLGWLKHYAYQLEIGRNSVTQVRRFCWGPIAATVSFALLAAFLPGCGDDDSDDVDATAQDEALDGEIIVFAASSLTDVFNAMAEAFGEVHPGVTVTFNFASSSALSTQINEGAPADVLASADNAQMKVVTDAGNASGPQIFATNSPVVVKPAGSDAFKDFAGLANPGLRLVLAGPDVPIGRYSREILTKASAGALGRDFSDRVLANLQSDEANVRAVLTKVQLGEADAGIVYATDATVGGDEVESIEIPVEYNVIAQYPIAAITDSGNAEAAAAWVAFVLSEDGQAILEEFGFGPAS